MRVLHLVASLNTGGAEKQLALLCEQSGASFAHTVLCVTGEGEWGARLRDAGVTLRTLGLASMKSPWLPVRLRQALKTIETDLIHCWLPSVNIAGALINRTLRGVRPPVLASVRNVDNWKPFLYRFLERCVSPLWSGVVCNSQAGVLASLISGIPEPKIRFIANGIEHRQPSDLLERQHARRSLGIDQDVLVVSTACRLTQQKRVDRFLASAREIWRELPSARFLVAGDGPLRAQLESRVSPEMKCAVRFMGRLDDVRPVLAASDFFVLCSEREGMSNALLEAMQAGCVPVVTSAGDNERIVRHGESGVVASPEGIGEAVLSAHRDRAGFNRYRCAAIESVAQYSTAAMVNNTLRLYKQLAAGQSAAMEYATS